MSKMHTLRLPTVRYRLTFRSFFGLKNQTSDIEMEYGFVKKGYFFIEKDACRKHSHHRMIKEFRVMDLGELSRDTKTFFLIEEF